MQLLLAGLKRPSFLLPKLSQVFSEIRDKKERNEKICTVYIEYGYTLKKIADYLGIHYSTVSRVIKDGERERKG